MTAWTSSLRPSKDLRTHSKSQVRYSSPTFPPQLSLILILVNTDYCPTLGLSPPTYRIEDDPSAPALYSGSAFFAAGSDVSGPVGSVRNVYGKKNAKEELAKQVLRFLELETEKRKA